MYIVQINSVDASWHSELVDAEAQRQRFIDLGRTNVEIVQKDIFGS